MTRMRTSLAAATAALMLLPASQVLAGVPYPTASVPKASDLGSTATVEGAAPITVTVVLKLRDPEGAREELKALTTPGTASFHEFLTPQQFRDSFGPSTDNVEMVSASLRALGLSVSSATSTTLRVTGSPTALEHAFQTSLHTFSVPAYDHHAGYSYHAPLAPVTLPAAAAPLVHAVLGLDTMPHLRPHLHALANKGASHPSVQGVPAGTSTGNAPGQLTVSDYAQHYNVTPLYSKGVTGHGRTLGIVTFAALTPSDAFAYWTAVGLTVDPNRLKIINVDGGPGAPSDASGSTETSLDVEQSGGIAPGARIVVYQAPNTNQAFIDAFAAAIDSNEAQTLSVSWGSWEWFNNLENSPVNDPYTGKTVGELQAVDELFLQAALQGQSLFASSGDTGAYDANDGTDNDGNPLTPPDYSLALSVDNPASDPYITAAGGTTLAGTQTYTVTGQPNFVVTIPQERVWSWDYLVGLCKELNLDPITCGIFPVGSGGGVSIEYRTPFYQIGVAGVQKSQIDQSFVDDLTIPPTTIYNLPGHFAGRNVPDISANADPDTGYVIYYASDVSGFGILSFYGGTSFVAPQLNGTTALLGEYLHDRLGLLNIPLYQLARNGGYAAPKAPLRAITQGSNDFYLGSKGYNPAAGLGVLNVGNLAEALSNH